MRYALHRSDPDLQEVHRQHPFIVVWDDHEIANNAWRDGAENHQPDEGEGDYALRRAAAVRAYLEWMPIREDQRCGSRGSISVVCVRRSGGSDHVDTRLVDRDELAPKRESISVIDDPKRSLLGRAQEEWLVAELAA